MSKVILTFSADWADEFQAEAFAIYSSREKAEARVQEVLKNGGYFGTNEGWEGWELDNGAFSIQDVTKEELAVIVKFFGKSFGTGLV